MCHFSEFLVNFDCNFCNNLCVLGQFIGKKSAKVVKRWLKVVSNWSKVVTKVLKVVKKSVVLVRPICCVMGI